MEYPIKYAHTVVQDSQKKTVWNNMLQLSMKERSHLNVLNICNALFSRKNYLTEHINRHFASPKIGHEINNSFK